MAKVITIEPPLGITILEPDKFDSFWTIYFWSYAHGTHDSPPELIGKIRASEDSLLALHDTRSWWFEKQRARKEVSESDASRGE